MGRFEPEPNTGCWLWTGASNLEGYGQQQAGGKVRLAHRLSYEQFVEPIPDGLVIDHKCCVPSCVNPDHLQAVSFGENIRLAFVRGAPTKPRSEFCRRGLHRMDGANVALRNGRSCRACYLAHMRSYNKTYERPAA